MSEIRKANKKKKKPDPPKKALTTTIQHTLHKPIAIVEEESCSPSPTKTETTSSPSPNKKKALNRTNYNDPQLVLNITYTQYEIMHEVAELCNFRTSVEEEEDWDIWWIDGPTIPALLVKMNPY